MDINRKVRTMIYVCSVSFVLAYALRLPVLEVSHNNFIALFFARELGENMTDEELRAMIDEFDRDGDGESKSVFI